jgi:hypothetical protein
VHIRTLTGQDADVARGDSTTWPAGMVTSTLALPGFGASTPPPPPARIPGRRRLRRTVVLFAVASFGLIAGSVAAVVESVMTTTPGAAPHAEPLREQTVLGALRTLGRQTLAARAFETEVVSDAAFPAFGEDVVYHGAADVAATVDFNEVGPEDVRVGGIGDRVHIRLPEVVLGDPVLDEEQSGAVYDTGFLDILFGATISEYELRETALADLAARARESGLAEEAAHAAAVEVRRRVGLLGARIVEVRFDR